MAGEMKDLVLNIITNAESASRQLRKFNRNLDDSDKKIKRVSKSTNLYARQLGNLFVGFPSKKNSKGEYKDICFPMNRDLREDISVAVLAEYEKIEAD